MLAGHASWQWHRVIWAERSHGGGNTVSPIYQTVNGVPTMTPQQRRDWRRRASSLRNRKLYRTRTSTQIAKDKVTRAAQYQAIKSHHQARGKSWRASRSAEKKATDKERAAENARKRKEEGRVKPMTSEQTARHNESGKIYRAKDRDVISARRKASYAARPPEQVAADKAKSKAYTAGTKAQRSAKEKGKRSKQTPEKRASENARLFSRSRTKTTRTTERLSSRVTPSTARIGRTSRNPSSVRTTALERRAARRQSAKLPYARPSDWTTSSTSSTPSWRLLSMSSPLTTRHRTRVDVFYRLR